MRRGAGRAPPIAWRSAFLISPLSKPWCEKKLMSSATRTAAFRAGAIAA
jgi:hypothetical protein